MDCLREQGLLGQIMPDNQEVLLRVDNFWNQWGHGWRKLKERAAVLRIACCSISHMLPESVLLTLCQYTPNPQD